MNSQKPEEKQARGKQTPQHHGGLGGFMHSLDLSAVLTVIGIVILFSMSIFVTLLAPRYVDPSWTSPTSTYQVQMYEIVDPNLYIGSMVKGSSNLEYIHHVKENFTLLAFHETESMRIASPPNLERYVTRYGDNVIKLTSHLLLLRKPQKSKTFDASAQAKKLRKEAQSVWEQKHPNWKEEGLIRPVVDILELYEPGGTEAFVEVASTEGMLENWVDENYKVLDESQKQQYHKNAGVVYVNNPQEYRYKHYAYANEEGWRYDPDGELVKSVEQLKSHALGFRSRAELISLGEHIYAIEGCWYCHTDQTRTLVQDVVLNGSAAYPAPPSAANEYIYQKITFPGTRRIGPDMSRVGVKRPSRDWHKGHFWSPKTASPGSIMPSFRHFFDDDPRGTSPNLIGIPNYQFEAIYQYLMTKGTRITPPTEAWWVGKDPVKTKEIIEGQRRLP